IVITVYASLYFYIYIILVHTSACDFYTFPYTTLFRSTVAETPLGPTDVRVENLIVGICGTDKHLHMGEFGPAYPLIPGHEIVGRVVEVGSSVTEVKVGETVAIDNTIYCARCDACKRGNFNFCENGVALGVQAPGGFATHTVAAVSKTHLVGDLDLDAAALIEPTACIVHGIDVIDLM